MAQSQTNRASYRSWILPGILIAVIAASWMSSSTSSHPLEGLAAPDFQARILDGGQVSLAALRGEDVVVLDFFATWCSPCRQALPLVEDAQVALADESVAFFAVNVAEQSAQVRDFFEATGHDLDVILDIDGTITTAYSASMLPTIVVIDRDGLVRSVLQGYHSGLTAELEARVREAMVPLPSIQA